MNIYLIRHGEPVVINNDFFESHLSVNGIKATQDMAKLIPKPEYIFTSPYNRTLETTKIFANHYKTNFITESALREWDLQSLNILEPRYKKLENKGWSDHKAKVDGGESLNDVKERISSYMNNIKKYKANNILIVSHGTIIDLYCASISNRAPKISDIKQMNYLDYAIIKYDGMLKMIKDII